MRTELTDLEIANFRINGFVIIRDFLADQVVGRPLRTESLPVIWSAGQ